MIVNNVAVTPVYALSLFMHVCRACFLAEKYTMKQNIGTFPQLLFWVQGYVDSPRSRDELMC